MPEVRVKWFHTEEFEAVLEVDDDFDIDADDAEEQLLDLIANMDNEDLTEAFEGCTNREITDKEME